MRRISGLLMRLQGFSIDFQQVRAKENSMADALSLLNREEKHPFDVRVRETDSTEEYPSDSYLHCAAIEPSSYYSDFTERDMTSALQIKNELDPLLDDYVSSDQPAIALEQRKDPLLLQVIIWLSEKQTAEQVQSMAQDPEL